MVREWWEIAHGWWGWDGGDRMVGDGMVGMRWWDNTDGEVWWEWDG